MLPPQISLSCNFLQSRRRRSPSQHHQITVPSGCEAKSERLRAATTSRAQIPPGKPRANYFVFSFFSFLSFFCKRSVRLNSPLFLLPALCDTIYSIITRTNTHTHGGSRFHYRSSLIFLWGSIEDAVLIWPSASRVLLQSSRNLFLLLSFHLYLGDPCRGGGRGRGGGGDVGGR